MHHFTTMIMEGFRAYVVAMPTTLFGDVGVLRAFLEEVQDMYSEFSQKGSQLESAADDATSNFAEARRSMFPALPSSSSQGCARVHVGPAPAPPPSLAAPAAPEGAGKRSWLDESGGVRSPRAL